MVKSYLKSQEDAETCYYQIARIFTFFLRKHAHDFCPTVMKNLLRTMRLALEGMEAGPIRQARLKIVRTAQLRLSRASRKVTLGRIISILPIPEATAIAQADVSHTQEVLGLDVRPTLTKEEKKKNRQEYFKSIADTIPEISLLNDSDSTEQGTDYSDWEEQVFNALSCKNET